MSEAHEPPPVPPAPRREANFDAELFDHALNEVHLLVDHVSGRPDKNLNTLEMVHPEDRNKKIFADEILNRVSDIRIRSQTESPTKEDLSFVLLAADALSTLAAPARSLTIAYTAMFVAARGIRVAHPLPTLQEVRRATAGEPYGDERAADRYLGLAIRSFPALRLHAAHARQMTFGALVFFVFLVFGAAWTYWDIAFGNSLADRLTSLAKERADILQKDPKALACMKKEKPAPPPAQGGGATPPCGDSTPRTAAPCDGTAPVCPPQTPAVPHPRPYTKPTPNQVIILNCPPLPVPIPDPGQNPGTRPNPPPDETASTHCQRLAEIDSAKRRLHDQLSQLIRCDDEVCSPPLFLLKWDWFVEITKYVSKRIMPSAIYEDEIHKPAASPSEKIDAIDADNASIEAILSVYSTYVLPLYFGILGTAIGALRQMREKIRDGELAPRDRWMLAVGLPMGVVAGLTVGLFFSPTETTVAGITTTAGRLTLSATALGFLAGYGSETFFSFIDTIFRQVFKSEKS